MSELKPDFCVALGFRMWGQLHTTKLDFEPLKLKADVGPCGTVKSKHWNCLFQEIMHPSGRGYSPGKWHPYILNVLNELWANREAPFPLHTFPKTSKAMNVITLPLLFVS